MEKFRDKYRIPSSRLQNWDYGWNAPCFVTICTAKMDCYFGEIANRKMQLSDIGKIAQKFWLEIPNHFPFVILDAFVVMPNHVHGIIIIDKLDDEFGGGGGRDGDGCRGSGGRDSGGGIRDSGGGDGGGGRDDSGGGRESGGGNRAGRRDKACLVSTSQRASQRATQHTSQRTSHHTNQNTSQNKNQNPSHHTSQHANQCPNQRNIQRLTNTPKNPSSKQVEKTIGQKRFQNQGKNTLSSIIGSYKSAVTKHSNRLGLCFTWQSRFHDHIIQNDKSYQRIKNYIINNPRNWEDDMFFK